jgi:hypothetical protein
MQGARLTIMSEDASPTPPAKALAPAAQRALAEAAARRAAEAKAAPAAEQGGPAGPEPTRYGDWERKGIAVDF